MKPAELCHQSAIDRGIPVFYGFSGQDLRIMALFGIMVFIGGADSQIITPLLPEMSKDFNQSPVDTNSLVTLYFAGSALASLMAGPLLDRYGRKRILLLGIGIAALTNLLAAGSSSFELVQIYRFCDGLGSSLASVAYLTHIGDYFPYDIRGRAMGWVTIGYFGGYTFGLPLSGLLAQEFGWRSTLAVYGISMAALLLGCLSMVPEIPRQRARINLYTFARDLFDFHRQTQPALAMLMYAFIGASTIGFLAYTGDWLFRDFGYSISDRSQIFLWCGMASLVFSPISGAWADRSGKRFPSIIGSIGITIMMPMIAFLPGHPVLIYSGFVLLAAAISIRQSPLLTLITELVPAERRGTFLAIKNAWTQIGAAFGNFAVGVLYDQGGFLLVAISCGILTAITVFLLIRYIKEPAPVS